MLSIRQFNILYRMISEKLSFKVKELMTNYNVSERSIKYDISQIKEFLKIYGYTMGNDQKNGIYINLKEEDYQNLLDILSKKYRHDVFLNKKVRNYEILLILLFSDGYVNSNKFTEELYISKNTLVKSMDEIEMYLRDNNISLKRKHGNGYKIDGDEIIIRNFYEYEICKNLSNYEISLMTSRIKSNANSKISLNFPGELLNYYFCIEEHLKKLFVSETVFTQDLILTIVRILISIVRVNQGKQLEKEINILRKTPLTSCIYDIFSQLNLLCEKSELAYMVGELISLEDINFPELTTELISYISEKQNIDFSKSEKLYTNVLNHLTSSMNNNILLNENPFHDLILNDYDKIYLDIKQFFKNKNFSSYLVISESFLSYVSLHFIVAMRELVRSNKIRVVFVCSTGKGVASILENFILSKIKDIEISATCSLNDVDKFVEKIKPDLIVSMFPISSPVPVIIVEAIPTEKNIEQIKQFVKNNIADTTKTSLKDEVIKIQDNSKADFDTSSKLMALGVTIHNKLTNEICIKDELKDAFLMHIMLMVHRCYFNRQYEGSHLTIDDKLATKIKQIIDSVDKDLNISLSEISFIINYVDIKD